MISPFSIIRLISPACILQSKISKTRLAHHRMGGRSPFAMHYAYELFARSNTRGHITHALITIIAAMAITYFITLFAAFSMGFEMETEFQELSRAKNAVHEISFTLQEQKTRVTEIHKPIFTSMEKISSIQYIQPSSVALSSFSSGNK